MDDPLRVRLNTHIISYTDVLILVVMDDPLRGLFELPIVAEETSLNPCCNG